jgi:hypothetical protein
MQFAKAEAHSSRLSGDSSGRIGEIPFSRLAFFLFSHFVGTCLTKMRDRKVLEREIAKHRSAMNFS